MTRKLASTLTPHDLEKHRIWTVLEDEVLDKDGCHEVFDAWVSPLDAGVVPRTAGGTYLVAATATLRDGAKRPSFVSVTVAGNAPALGAVTLLLGDTQHLVQSSNPSTLYGGGALSDAEKAMLPLTWVLEALLEGEEVRRGGSATASPVANFFKRLRG